MDPLHAEDDLARFTIEELRAIERGLERRRPGAPVASIGIRPHRTPWTYRDIRRLAAVHAELARRQGP